MAPGKKGRAGKSPARRLRKYSGLQRSVRLLEMANGKIIKLAAEGVRRASATVDGEPVPMNEQTDGSWRGAETLDLADPCEVVYTAKGVPGTNVKFTTNVNGSDRVEAKVMAGGRQQFTFSYKTS